LGENVSKKFIQKDELNPYMCEHCHKREATKQRVTGLLVCDQCDKELDDYIAREKSDSLRRKAIKALREELGREPTESEIQTSLLSIDENMG